MSRIENAAEAVRYERLCHDYLLALNKLEKQAYSKNIYIRIVLDPFQPPISKVAIEPFTSKSRNIESRVYFWSSQTVDWNRDRIISDIGNAIIVILRTLQEQLPDSNKNHLESIEEAVKAVTLRFVPGWKPNVSTDEGNRVAVEEEGAGEMISIEIPEDALGSFDEIGDIEEALHLAAHPYGVLDGHDIGQGVVTFFIEATNIVAVSEPLKAVLRARGLLERAALYRRRGTEEPKRIE